jgi:TRAP-type C4-dicarboxylate transport system substrate-binding protein
MIGNSHGDSLGQFELAFPDTMEGKLAAYNTFTALIDKYPVMADEWKRFKPIFFNMTGTYHILSKNKEIHTPTDIKGMKVGALGLRQDFMKLCGAVPVFDVPPLAYVKLQTGVTDATCVAWDAIGDFQLREVGKYLLEIDVSEGIVRLVMNWDSWNKVSARDQQIMMDLAPQGVRAGHEALINYLGLNKKKFLDYGCTVITPTSDEKALWLEKSKLLWDDWVSKQEAKGVTSAKEILNAWQSASDRGRALLSK